MSDDTEERIQSFSPGEIILKEGEPGNTAYIIHQGSVEVTKKLLGKDQALGTLQKGDFFGEISLITAVPRTATVKALEEVQLLENVIIGDGESHRLVFRCEKPVHRMGKIIRKL